MNRKPRLEWKIYWLTIIKSQNGEHKWTSKRKQKYMTKKHRTKPPLVSTYKNVLPNISNIDWNHWNILNISRTPERLFQEQLITDFNPK